LISGTLPPTYQMKYFVAYPISYDCNLRCSYCFHAERHSTNYTQPRLFTLEDWCRFRDTHLKGAEDIIVHFHGGETFLPTNSKTIQAFMRGTTVERADILTNGIQSPEDYRTISEYAGRVHRVGMTFHRRMIGDVPELVALFESNANLIRSLGVPVYIKELLFAGSRPTLLEAKRMWEGRGFKYKIQDFKGTDRGRSFEDHKAYTAEDLLAIDSEYKRGGTECACVRGYRNILIRGGWQDGDILACFEDPKVIGSVQRNEYLPGYKIVKDFQEGRIDVQCEGASYKGTWDRDLYVPPPCGTN